ncbi:MAG TPA: HlyC/CorC family transporter [Candidatus Wirthbacteria bacterium]|nr:HlyC/CorC family transporter [Candidatus Wirthbacteria bacterium]
MLALIVILLSLSINGLLAAYELALTSASLDKLNILKSGHKKGTKDAVFMKENIEGSLSIIQIGITFCGIIAGATGGSSLADKLSPELMGLLPVNKGLADLLAMLLTVVPIGTFSIIFGELIPKVYALRKNISICLVLSPWMRKFYIIANPLAVFFESTVKTLISLIDHVTGQKDTGNQNNQMSIKDLRLFASLSRRAKLISKQEEKIIVGATKLSSRPVRDIMIPLLETVFLALDKTINQNLMTAHLEAHTRYPVLESSINQMKITGYVNLKQLFFFSKANPQAQTIQPVLRPVITIRDNTSIADTLERMVEDSLHLVVLTNHQNKPVGILTLEDVIEELVGDIENEFDVLPHYIHKHGNYWVAGGGISIKHLVKATKLMPLEDLPPHLDPKTSLSDYVEQNLKHIPHKNDKLDLGNISLRIKKVKRNHAHELIAQDKNLHSNRPVTAQKATKGKTIKLTTST